jgi:hypothetical protein
VDGRRAAWVGGCAERHGTPTTSGGQSLDGRFVQGGGGRDAARLRP